MIVELDRFGNFKKSSGRQCMPTDRGKASSNVGSRSDLRTIIWGEALNIIREQLNVPTFKTWFENTTPVNIYDDTMVISVSNSFQKDWLESRYTGLIKEAVNRATDNNLTVEIVVSPPPPTISSFNPKYSFDSFVTGAGNRFAHAAALAVAESPSKAYNPLFIYGGVGLGKTHLLHAIGQYVNRHAPHLKVKYVSSEEFTSDFVNSIRGKDNIVDFQNRYGNNDVLLVDNIQFLENKEATQEAFFHTFDMLYEADRQIVIGSDRAPKDLPTLEDRFRSSRFEWGLTTDIQPPDLETRIAILRKKASTESLPVPDDVMEFIAPKIQSNIRELEGRLVRVAAFASLTKSFIDLKLARDALKDILPGVRPIPVSRDMPRGTTVQPGSHSVADSFMEVRGNIEWWGSSGSSEVFVRLVELLKDRDWVTRRKAAEALGRPGNWRAIEHLVEALGDKSWQVREKAGQAIVRINPERAVESFSLALNGKSWIACKEAANLLGELGEEKAVPLLERLLNHDRISVRRSAVKAFGRIGKKSIPFLKEALKDSAESVRREACRALRMLGSSS